MNPDYLNFHLDSQLIVRQINGQYKVKAKHLLPLYLQATNLLTNLRRPYRFQDIPRSLNRLADSLANQAMDQSHDLKN